MYKIFLILFLIVISIYADRPNLLLLKTYSKDINVTGWYMSEKLDGIRAYWDGKNFISRGGNIFTAPAFFTKGFPKFKLDGELWSRRADFENISSIVSTSKIDLSMKPLEFRWKQLTFNVFEVPEAKGNLLQRLSKVKETKYLKLIKQIKVKNIKHLENFHKTIEKEGGEGVVVRDGSLPYYTGRASSALKVKSFLDDECIVVGHMQGKGKYKNKLGSIKCKQKSGKIIKIGSGFNDLQRKNPPIIGSVITFKYYGLTSKGNPRFPVFLRVRK